jgi:hypothetical protein
MANTMIATNNATIPMVSPTVLGLCSPEIKAENMMRRAAQPKHPILFMSTSLPSPATSNEV